MSVLLFAELSEGSFRKAALEAATYSRDLATLFGGDVHAIVFGNPAEAEINKLKAHGVSKVYRVSAISNFAERAMSAAIAQAAQNCGARAVVMSQTYDGKALSARVAVRLDAAHLSGVTSMATGSAGALEVRRTTSSGKGIETVKSNRAVAVVTVKANAYGVKENPAASCSVEDMSFDASAFPGAVTKEKVRASSSVSLTEAEVVVSGGRGMKDPSNWHLLETLADLLGAGKACSKPVADTHWRPHHEHVGQTGIQIAPNLYIAVGISGAIQHLAGVNSSKNIVVINTDPEAPFFKIADFGIVGDALQVVPKITEAVKKLKAQH